MFKNLIFIIFTGIFVIKTCPLSDYQCVIEIYSKAQLTVEKTNVTCILNHVDEWVCFLYS